MTRRSASKKQTSKSLATIAKKKGVQKEQEKALKSDTASEQVTITQLGDDNLELIVVGHTVKTVDDAIKKGAIDLRLWKVIGQELKAWEVAGKMNTGQDENGRWKGEKLWKQPLWRVRVTLERRAPKGVQDGIEDLVAEFRKNPPPLPKITYKKESKPYLLELSLFDVHLGKRCWDAEAGGGDYDLKIAEYDYLAAVEDLLDKVKGYKIGKILFPLGSDFFQQNSWVAETARGTPVDSVDDRFQRVFQVGCRSLEHAIKRCREVAPVKTLHIPGNHDPATSWYMCEWLAARFGRDKHVTFDNEPKSRKYERWGSVLLGFTHEPLKDLPLIMAREQQAAWAEAKYFEWHVGHFHKKKERDYIAGDTYNGVRVAVLPSLSGTDRWHHDQGYIGNTRMAETYLWSEVDGPIGHFSTMARTERTRLGLQARIA